MINTNSEEDMNRLFYDLNFFLDNQLTVFYGRNSEGSLEEGDLGAGIGN